MLRKLLLLVILLSGLIPFGPASSQDNPTAEILLGIDFETGRLVGFTVEDGAAQIFVDMTPDPNLSVDAAWRLTPTDVLVVLEGDNLPSVTYWMTPDGLQDVSAVFEWEKFGNAVPVLSAHHKVVLFDGLSNFNDPLLIIVDLTTMTREVIPYVDIPGPRLSADGTTLRVLALVPDTDDQWAVTQVDMMTGATAVLDIFTWTSVSAPFIQTDPHGEYWLLRPERPELPYMVALDGTSTPISTPLEGDNLPTGLRDNHLFQVDLSCTLNCVMYARTPDAAEWTTYVFPDFLGMDVIQFGGFVGDDFFFWVSPSNELMVVHPVGTVDAIGFQNSAIRSQWSLDRSMTVVTATEENATAYAVYSLTRHAVLFSFETDAIPAVLFGAGGIAVPDRDVRIFYSHRTGEVYDLPVAPDEQTIYRGFMALADGSLLISASREEGDVETLAILIDDITTADPPTGLIEGVIVWPVRPLAALR